MLMRRQSHGLTLVEMLIGLAVLGMLLGLGVPSFMVWMQGQQVRNAADAVLNGMQLARAEAIRRNKPVEFALGNQSGWVVTQVNPKLDIQKRSEAEGSPKVNVAPTPAGTYAVTFDALGGPTDNPDGSMRVSSLLFTSQVSNSAIRSLQIVVSVSGTIRMCDPDPNNELKAGDPRKCNI
jgi:type IV fimbrial biogenesis protein FimT